MAHFVKTRPGGYINGSSRLPAEDLDDFEDKMVAAVNGDGGGLYEPTEVIEILGKGLKVGKLRLTANASYVEDIDALKSLSVADLLDGHMVYVKRFGWYYYESGTATAESSPWLIAPTSGSGRWLNQNKSLINGSYGIPGLNSAGKIPAALGGAASTIATLNGSSKVVEHSAWEDIANGVAVLDAASPPKLKASYGGSASTLATLNGLAKVVEHSSWEDVANGVAKLDSASPPKLKASYGGTLNTLATLNGSALVVEHSSWEDVANGVAKLDSASPPKLKASYGGAANTLATLDGAGEVVQRLSYEGDHGGVATLDGAGHVNAAQLAGALVTTVEIHGTAATPLSTTTSFADVPDSAFTAIPTSGQTYVATWLINALVGAGDCSLQVVDNLGVARPITWITFVQSGVTTITWSGFGGGGSSPISLQAKKSSGGASASVNLISSHLLVFG